jgi:hypothetical protein
VSISFQCGSCGKGFRVKDELGGRKAKCSCGASVSIPRATASAVAAKAAAPAARPAPRVAAAVPAAGRSSAADDELFDEEMASATKSCPSCKSVVKLDTVLCVKCGYNFRERKKVETEVAAVAAPAPGMRCSNCNSTNARSVNDGEWEAYRDRKETAVTVGRPLICKDCGNMWEPPASFASYIKGYGRGVVLFVAGVIVTMVTLYVVWIVFAGRMLNEDGDMRFSPFRAARLLKSSYPALGVVFFGLSLAGAGIWGMMRTLIVQMGWKSVLYDPDDQKW